MVGCGLGDDAEELARRGFDVTAFDVSAAAIDWAKKRFPQTKVKFHVADLFNLPAAWRRGFDLVSEIFTVQALPVQLRPRALTAVADLVAPQGTLLIFCRGRDDGEQLGEMPWPLSREDLSELGRAGLTERSFEDFQDQEDPPIRRFRAVYERA